MDKNFNMIKEKYYRMLNRPEWFKRREEILEQKRKTGKHGSPPHLIVSNKYYIFKRKVQVTEKENILQKKKASSSTSFVII